MFLIKLQVVEDDFQYFNIAPCTTTIRSLHSVKEPRFILAVCLFLLYEVLVRFIVNMRQLRQHTIYPTALVTASDISRMLKVNKYKQQTNHKIGSAILK